MYKFVKYHFELVAWKRQKLKLGAIVFEIKEITFAEVILYEEAEIRYIRQDTSEDDALKIENRLEAIKWRWDYKNIGAFLIIFGLVYLFVRARLILWYKDNLPAFASKDEGMVELLRFTFKMILQFSISNNSHMLSFLNLMLVDTLTKFCSDFGFLI